MKAVEPQLSTLAGKTQRRKRIFVTTRARALSGDLSSVESGFPITQGLPGSRC